jgi:hypothetical protein
MQRELFACLLLHVILFSRLGHIGLAHVVASPAQRRRVELGHAARVLLAGRHRAPPARDGWNGGLAVGVVSPAPSRVIGEDDAAHVVLVGCDRLPPARNCWDGGLAVAVRSPAS